MGSQGNVGPGQAVGGRSPQKRLNQGNYFVKSASREPTGKVKDDPECGEAETTSRVMLHRG